jgi:hypothetical protein
LEDGEKIRNYTEFLRLAGRRWISAATCRGHKKRCEVPKSTPAAVLDGSFISRVGMSLQEDADCLLGSKTSKIWSGKTHQSYKL